jgi:hypothetical protein
VTWLRSLVLLPLLAASCEKAEAPADAGAPAADVPVAEVPFEPPAAVMRRLTRTQYLNTLRDVFGSDVVLPASVEPDTAREGFFSIGASESAVSRRGVEQFQAAAFDIASQVLRNEGQRMRLIGCAPAGTQDDACARTALTTLARRLWRRAVTEDEITPFVRVSGEAATALGDFHRGLEYGLAGLLQSTDLLYRPEVGATGRCRARARATRPSSSPRASRSFSGTGPPTTSCSPPRSRAPSTATTACAPRSTACSAPSARAAGCGPSSPSGSRSTRSTG